MTIKKITSVFCSSLLICQLGFAQFEIQKLLQVAEQNHPIWLARKYESDAKRSQKEVLKNAVLPNIDATYQANIATFNNLTGMFYGQGLLPISGPPSDNNSFSPTTGSAVGLMATWSPLTFGALGAKIKVAEQEILTYESETQDRLLRHQTEVIQHYLEVLRIQSLLQINGKNQQRLAKMLILVRDLVKNGLKPEADTSFVRSELIRSQIEQRSYQGQIQRSKNKLAELIGQASVEVNDTTWLNQLPTVSQNPTTISHPSEQVVLRLNEVENARLGAIQKGFLPKLTFFGTTFARGSGVNNGFLTGLGFQRFNYGLGVHLAIPILKGTEKNTLLSQQNLRIKATNEQLNVVRLSLQQQMASAQSLLDETREITNRMPDLLNETQKVFGASQQRYQTGLVSLNEVIQAQYQLQKVESEASLAKLNVWQALLLYAYAKGDLKVFLGNN